MNIMNIKPEFREEFRNKMLNRPVNLQIQFWGENKIIISTDGCGCCSDNYTTENKEEEILATQNHIKLLEDQVKYWKNILEKLEE